MAPQSDIPLSANVLGTLGTDFGVFKIWKMWRSSSTEGVTGLMFILWSCACPSFGAYAIIQNFNVPLQIQPNVMCGLCLIGWGQTLYYHNRLSLWKVLVMVFAAGSFGAALELVMVFTVRPRYEGGLEWPVTFIGIVSTILILAGLVPPYFELVKRRGRVVGLSFTFLTIDIAGAAFSLLALIVQHTFDLLGGLLYILVMAMEVGIVGSQIVWLIRTRESHKAARDAGLSYDNYLKSLKRASCTSAERSSDDSNNNYNEHDEKGSDKVIV